MISPIDSVEILCEGKIFTKSEVAPMPKGGFDAYEKTLMNYLKENKINVSNGSIILLFTISKTGSIIEINENQNSIKEISDILDAIKKASNLWLPCKSEWK